MTIGLKINNLTVVKDLGQVLYKTDSGFQRNRHRVIVRCVCGKEKEVSLSEMKCRKYVSCGCMKKNNKKHNLRSHPLYCIFEGMKSRCYNDRNRAFNRYGGRGINICSEWLKDFVSFYNWSCENGYKKGLQIDRINNNGDYSPDNCRWVTPKENSRNRRNTIYLEYKGIRKQAVKWAEDLGINYNTFKWRLANGWCIDKIMSTKVK